MVPSDGILNIEGVFGAGDLNVEYILIRNQSNASVNLSGWSVSSSDGKTYNFPQLTLNTNGAVRLYSKHGTNTVIELYWNSDQSLWASGSQILLLDQSGQQQANWQVP
jgi:micrococcal nuclease